MRGNQPWLFSPTAQSSTPNHTSETTQPKAASSKQAQPTVAVPHLQERLIVACLGAMLAARWWRRLSLDHLMGTSVTYIKVSRKSLQA